MVSKPNWGAHVITAGAALFLFSLFYRTVIRISGLRRLSTAIAWGLLGMLVGLRGSRLLLALSGL